MLQIPAPVALHWREIKAKLKQQQERQQKDEAQTTAATLMVLPHFPTSLRAHRSEALGTLD